MITQFVIVDAYESETYARKSFRANALRLNINL